ncbi:hypothetical protein GY45DRAFT_1341317 [Cubamyces sp. BRFM 1775]|nr:hypothetical protein GY45DRAFT_1341317 [Cubamyces sp. BRFM 1775]
MSFVEDAETSFDSHHTLDECSSDAMVEFELQYPDYEADIETSTRYEEAPDDSTTICVEVLPQARALRRSARIRDKRRNSAVSRAVRGMVTQGGSKPVNPKKRRLNVEIPPAVAHHSGHRRALTIHCPPRSSSSRTSLPPPASRVRFYWCQVMFASHYAGRLVTSSKLSKIDCKAHEIRLNYTLHVFLTFWTLGSYS